MKVSRGLLAGFLLTLAVPVCAQTLGELAKKEQERRKAAPPATKVYTNEDLKKIIPPPGGVVTTSDAKPGDAKADAAKGDAQKADAKPGDAKAGTPKDDVKDEAYWSGRMKTAREEMRRNEAFRDALQSRINGLSADFSARDDPYQRAQIADDRQKALAEMARVNTEIENVKKTIAEIEDEARRAGVPAGWIR